jgi:hypothetical protein
MKTIESILSIDKSIFFLSLGVILLIPLSSCKKKSVNCGVECDGKEMMIFQSNFDNTTIIKLSETTDGFSGKDLSLDSLNDWKALNNHPNIGDLKINYEDGDNSQRYAEISLDPKDSTNNVLHYKIIEPHIKNGLNKKGRVQATLGGNQCIKEYYQTVKLYLHPDIEYLKQWNEVVHWFSLFEFWNNGNWTGEKYPFRVTVNLVKTTSETVSEMYFQAKGDHQKTGKWKDDWRVTAENFSVPFGKWMTLELYIKEGDPNNGRFYMSVTPEGETKIELFDLTKTTQHPKEKCADGYTHLQPLKLYTSDKVINYMKDNNKNLEVFWDDWRVYLNKQY